MVVRKRAIPVQEDEEAGEAPLEVVGSSTLVLPVECEAKNPAPSRPQTRKRRREREETYWAGKQNTAEVAAEDDDDVSVSASEGKWKDRLPAALLERAVAQKKELEAQEEQIRHQRESSPAKRRKAKKAVKKIGTIVVRPVVERQPAIESVPAVVLEFSKTRRVSGSLRRITYNAFAAQKRDRRGIKSLPVRKHRHTSGI